MNSADCQWNDFDAERVFDSIGVYRHGIAEAVAIEPEANDRYEQWLARGYHAGMDYLTRYQDVRSNPQLLLEGARSIICCAFPYYYPIKRADAKTLRIARYALGDDYHDTVRRRLEKAAARIREIYGGETRVCVDTAPLRERYWAERSGLGFIGRNNHLIIPGAGSYFFLGEILTTVGFRPTAPSADILAAKQTCADCYRCIKACPTGALLTNGVCNARKCLSYITIEHRGDFSIDTKLHGSFYGCDRCGDACPHNANPLVNQIEELLPRPKLLNLTADDMLNMTQEEYAQTFRGSAMKRAKLTGLQRNAAQILKENTEK